MNVNPRGILLLLVVSLGGIMIFGWLTGEDSSLLQPGTEAPDFRLPSHDGTTVHLADYRGKKNIVLIFYPLDSSPT